MTRIRPEALDWLGEAKADIRHANQSYKLGSHNWACFVAEQAAEKAIKAFLIGVLKKRPTHTHDLTALHKQTEEKLKLPSSISYGLSELSAHYTGARYPNSGINRPSVSINAIQARRAIRIARGVVNLVEKQIARRR